MEGIYLRRAFNDGGNEGAGLSWTGCGRGVNDSCSAS